MKKYLVFIVTMCSIGFISYGQEMKPRTDVLKNDPVNKKRAAKADSRLIDMKDVVGDRTKKQARHQGRSNKKASRQPCITRLL